MLEDDWKNSENIVRMSLMTTCFGLNEISIVFACCTVLIHLSYKDSRFFTTNKNSQ